MGGTSPQPIGQTTPPGGSLQIYLPQTSPAAAGEHQGFWMLRSPAGGDFALGQNASVAFWVKIRVSPGAPAPTAANPPASIPTPVSASTLGPPSQTWSFNNNKAPFYLGDDSSVSYKVNNNMLIMTAFTTGDMWRVAEGSYIANFALEARFVTGAQCAGRDSYGLLARAPSQPDNIIDSGYIFTFNCDGQFRIYRMDNGNYTGLYNWTNAPSIRAGANQENVMQVAGQGAMLSLSANGQLLAQFNDPTYSGGLFGLIIGSGGTPNLQVGLRQLSLWTLP
jgi:hypothetical protein